MITALVVLAAATAAPAGEICEASLARAVNRAGRELFALLDSSEAVRARHAAILAETADLPDVVIDRLRSLFFERDFSVSVGAVPDDADVVVEAGMALDGDGGVLRVRCSRPPLGAVAVRFLGKDWVDRADPGRSGAGRARRFAGRSGIEGAREEAENAAFDDALRALRREVASRAGLDARAHGGVIERETAGPIIRAAYWRDSFVEVEARPYGAIYRGHVLLEVPERDVEALGARARALLARDRWTWVLRGGLLSLLACVLFLVYVTADGWLRGTCTRALRLLSTAVFVAAAVALLGLRL